MRFRSLIVVVNWRAICHSSNVRAYNTNSEYTKSVLCMGRKASRVWTRTCVIPTAQVYALSLSLSSLLDTIACCKFVLYRWSSSRNTLIEEAASLLSGNKCWHNASQNVEKPCIDPYYRSIWGLPEFVRCVRLAASPIMVSLLEYPL